MALNMGNISEEDRQAQYNRMHPPENEPGFGPSSDGSSGGGDFDSLDDFGSDLFGGSSGESGGDSFGSFGSTGDFGGFGASSGGDGSGWGASQFNSGFNAGAPGTQNQQQGPDVMDKMMDAGAEGLTAIAHILVDMAKSIGTRTSDEWASVGNTCTIIGLVVSAISVVLAIVGWASDVKMLRMANLPSTGLMWGLLTTATGLGLLSAMIMFKLKTGEYSDGATAQSSLESMDDVSNDFDASSLGNEFDNTYSSESFSDDDSDDNMDSLIDSILNDDAFKETVDDKKEDTAPVERPVYNPENLIQEIHPESMLNRHKLLDVFIPFFPTNSPDFAKVTQVEKDSEAYLSLGVILQKAIATAADKEDDEIQINIRDIKETMFSYIIKFERHKSFKKIAPEKLEDEIVNYSKADAEDDTVTAELKIIGGDYILTLSKGKSFVVTIGDCFLAPSTRDYFENTKNRLPFITGVDDLGAVQFGDAKDFPSMMIVGIARSGKSWYVTSFIMSLAAFNDPNTVQFLIIDPKDSQLFKTIALLPHVCGLHTHKNILAILHDVLEKEAPRRKQILADHGCDTLWELRETKHIEIPFLYIIIDEVMTVIKSLALDKRDGEFLNLLIQIITQLPSLGIGILIVPHRAQGVVDKTTRSQMQFKAAVRAPSEVIKETLDVNKWSRPLVSPGEIALLNSSMKNAKFVRGTGITLSDTENNVMIANVARAYYKMGVEIPEMDTIGCGYNRDPEAIREKLDLKFGKKEQFDIDSD